MSAVSVCILLLYSFQNTNLLKPFDNSFVNSKFSLVFKVTTGAYNSVFVILNLVLPSTLDVTQFFVQFSSKCYLVLINGISNDLRNDGIYFKGTIFVPTFFVVNPFNKFVLYLKEVELVELKVVRLFCIAIKILKIVHNYQNAQLSCTCSLLNLNFQLFPHAHHLSMLHI